MKQVIFPTLICLLLGMAIGSYGYDWYKDYASKKAEAKWRIAWAQEKKNDSLIEVRAQAIYDSTEAAKKATQEAEFTSLAKIATEKRIAKETRELVKLIERRIPLTSQSSYNTCHTKIIYTTTRRILNGEDKSYISLSAYHSLSLTGVDGEYIYDQKADGFHENSDDVIDDIAFACADQNTKAKLLVTYYKAIRHWKSILVGRSS